VPEILGQIGKYIFKLPQEILNVSTHSRCSLKSRDYNATTLEALGNIRGIILTY